MWASHLTHLGLRFFARKEGKTVTSVTVTWVARRVEWGNNATHLAVSDIVIMTVSLLPFSSEMKSLCVRDTPSAIKDSTGNKEVPLARKIRHGPLQTKRYTDLTTTCVSTYGTLFAIRSNRKDEMWSGETVLYLQPYHLLATWPWTNHLSSLCLFNQTCKAEIKITAYLSERQGRNKKMEAFSKQKSNTNVSVILCQHGEGVWKPNSDLETDYNFIRRA